MNNKHNKKGHRHGYWERKYHNGEVWVKHTYNNGMYLGYGEWYYENGKIGCKGICI